MKLLSRLLFSALMFLAAAYAFAGDPISPTDPHIQIIGRVDARDPARVRIGYPGVTVRFRFTGTLAVVGIAIAVHVLML